LWAQCIIWIGKIAIGLRFKDRLEGASNFRPWKEIVSLLLEENEIWNIVEKGQTIPIDLVILATYKKNNVKAKRIILDSMKDHIILHVTGKTHAYDISSSLMGLYQIGNQNRKMVL
jgi:hypothetical protein